MKKPDVFGGRQQECCVEVFPVHQCWLEMCQLGFGPSVEMRNKSFDLPHQTSLSIMTLVLGIKDARPLDEGHCKSLPTGSSRKQFQFVSCLRCLFHWIPIEKVSLHTACWPIMNQNEMMSQNFESWLSRLLCSKAFQPLGSWVSKLVGGSTYRSGS